MSLGSNRALLAAAGVSTGLKFGDEAWMQVDSVTVSGNSNLDVTFTSGGSEEAWSSFRDMVVMVKAKSQAYSEQNLMVEVNNIVLSTTSNRQYYNAKRHYMAGGTGTYTYYENTDMQSGDGDEYASKPSGVVVGYQGGRSNMIAPNIITFYDINSTQTKYWQHMCFPGKVNTGTSQDSHPTWGYHSFYYTSRTNTPAITTLNFYGGDGHNWRDGATFALYGILGDET